MQLSIRRGNETNAIISWTPLLGDRVLQERTNLNITNRTTAPSGGANPATVNATNAVKFGRLVQP